MSASSVTISQVGASCFDPALIVGFAHGGTKKKIIPILFILLAGQAPGQTLEEARKTIEDMNWITEQYPPFNFKDESDGELKGITVDILMEIFKSSAWRRHVRTWKFSPGRGGISIVSRSREPLFIQQLTRRNGFSSSSS